LAVCITGTKEIIAFKLRKIAEEIEKGEEQKPMQGVTVSERSVTEVLTPLWNGVTYEDAKSRLDFNE
jgi:hypothetical protein